MNKNDKKPLLLVTGALSYFSKILSPALAQNYELIGVDLDEPSSEFNFPGTYYHLDYRKRSFLQIFRDHSFWGILHLGRIRATSYLEAGYRFEQNVLGTKTILKEGYEHGIRNFVVISSYQVYGAFKENYLYIKEDESLKACQTVPELSDAVVMDYESQEFMLRHPGAKVTILRPCSVIGADAQSPIMTALSGSLAPVLFGFDPLMQFLHQKDFIKAVLLVLAQQKKGVFNLAGEGVISYSDALKTAGAKAVLCPSFVFSGVFKWIGYRLPKHFLDFLKYPVVVSDELFKKTFNFKPDISLKDSLSHLI